MDLNTLWFWLVGFLLAGYAVLDGFDLGVGILHLTVKKGDDRRTLMNAIGPLWDGNEVWLVAAGGALFAAFPNVYATVFSGFYLAFILFLVALIFRGVAMEFRGKLDNATWRAFWDTAFSGGSTLAALLLGVAFGNLVRGVPVGPDGEFAGTFLSLLNPFALFIGVAAVAVFAVHGACYLAMKTEGALKERVLAVAGLGSVLIPLFITVMVGYGIGEAPLLRETLSSRPLLFVLPALGAVAGFLIRYLPGNPFRAFLSSSLSILLTLVFFFAVLYPHMVYSPGSPANSLTAYNASSSPMTLKVMWVIACIALPLVFFYTFWVYRVFRGTVKLEHEGY